MVVDSGPSPARWRFSFGGTFWNPSADSYKSRNPGGLCVFVVYRADLSPVQKGPDMDSWVTAAAKEIADPVRCRFLVMKSAENTFKAKYPTETDVDNSDDACELIIAVKEVRETEGLPSLVTYKEEEPEPTSVGQWHEDAVVPPSKERGPTAIAGRLQFTGDETVFTPLRV